MTRFEKIKNMSLEEMTDAVLTLVCNDVCLNNYESNCDECIFYDLCQISPEDDVKEWLESEVGNELQ